MRQINPLRARGVYRTPLIPSWILVGGAVVVALIGAYQSSVTFASTAVAERYGIPWVVGDSVAANITGRGVPLKVWRLRLW